MKIEQPITIRQVANGFIVESIQADCARVKEQEVVCQSMAELTSYIEAHFMFRQEVNIKND